MPRLDPTPGGNLTLSLDDVRELVREHGRNDDPVIRQQLARLVTLTSLGRWNALRAKAEAARGGGESVANIGKLTQTRIMKLSAEIALDILGASGDARQPRRPGDGRFTHSFVFSAASSIYGGTDEIQRNIVGERSLGLPRDPNPDRDVPYGEVLRRSASNDR